MKARQLPSPILASSRVHVQPCAYFRPAIKLQSCHKHRRTHNEPFIQFDVKLHSLPRASAQASQAGDMFILLEVRLLRQSEAALTRTDDLRVLLRSDAGRWRPAPPPSRCLHKRGTGTCDWTLPQAISITRAGGTASRCSAVAIATDPLSRGMQGCKSAARLRNENVERRSKAWKKKRRGDLSEVELNKR